MMKAPAKPVSTQRVRVMSRQTANERADLASDLRHLAVLMDVAVEVSQEHPQATDRIASLLWVARDLVERLSADADRLLEVGA